MYIKISLRGASRLKGKLARAMNLRRALAESVDAAHAQVTEYPSASGRYRRTGKLAASWKKTETGVYTDLRYAPHVQGHEQAGTFAQRGWRNIAEIARDLGPKVTEIYAKHIRRAWR